MSRHAATHACRRESSAKRRCPTLVRRGSRMDTDPKQGESLSHGLSRTGPKRCRAAVYHSAPLRAIDQSKNRLAAQLGANGSDSASRNRESRFVWQATSDKSAANRPHTLCRRNPPKTLGEYKGPFRSLAPPTHCFGHPSSSARSATHPHYADAASAWEDREDLGLDDSCYRALTLRAPAQRKL